MRRQIEGGPNMVGLAVNVERKATQYYNALNQQAFYSHMAMLFSVLSNRLTDPRFRSVNRSYWVEIEIVAFKIKEVPSESISNYNRFSKRKLGILKEKSGQLMCFIELYLRKRFSKYLSNF